MASNKDVYESIEPGYYYRAMESGPCIQRCWHRMKFAHVAKSIPEQGKVLDIGCGPGSLAAVLGHLRPAIDYVGVDIAGEQIEFAKSAVKPTPTSCEFICLQSEELPFPAASIDCIVMTEFIEHLETDQLSAIFKECRRLLKPAGSLLVTTPNYRSHWPALEVLLEILSPVKYAEQHITHFQPENLQAFLGQERFQLKTLETFMSLAPFLGIVGEAIAAKAFRWESAYGLLPGALIFAECTLSEPVVLQA